MSSLRIGCDLCQIAAIEQMLKDDEAALERLFTSEERQYAMTQARPAQHLAGVFATKEALAKAVRVPGLLGKYYKEVSVSHRDDGAPVLCLSSTLGETLSKRGMQIADCSISHDGAYALATVLVEVSEPLSTAPQCHRCLLTLESLHAQGITDVLVRVEHADGTTRYLCPVCIRGW